MRILAFPMFSLLLNKNKKTGDSMVKLDENIVYSTFLCCIKRDITSNL